MNLSHDQMAALESGEPVTCVLDHTECVVVRKDIFERIVQLADSPWTVDEMRTIAERTFDDADQAEAIR